MQSQAPDMPSFNANKRNFSLLVCPERTQVCYPDAGKDQLQTTLRCRYHATPPDAQNAVASPVTVYFCCISPPFLSSPISTGH